MSKAIALAATIKNSVDEEGRHFIMREWEELAYQLAGAVLAESKVEPLTDDDIKGFMLKSGIISYTVEDAKKLLNFGRAINKARPWDSQRYRK